MSSAFRLCLAVHVLAASTLSGTPHNHDVISDPFNQTCPCPPETKRRSWSLNSFARIVLWVPLEGITCHCFLRGRDFLWGNCALPLLPCLEDLCQGLETPWGVTACGGRGEATTSAPSEPKPGPTLPILWGTRQPTHTQHRRTWPTKSMNAEVEPLPNSTPFLYPF